MIVDIVASFTRLMIVQFDLPFLFIPSPTLSKLLLLHFKF
jgi:hypothetical protein